MAKSPHDEMSDANKPPSSGRESQFGGRHPSSFERETQAAGRGAQFAAAQLTPLTLLEPYTDLLRQMETFHQQWANGMRATAERTLDVASRLNEAVIAEARRNAEIMYRAYEADLSSQSSLARDVQQRTSSALRQGVMSGQRAEAAE